jgi:hypothetical protein
MWLINNRRVGHRANRRSIRLGVANPSQPSLSIRLGGCQPTKLLEEAINSDDGDCAARIIQEALGIESDDVAH